ncbi:LysR family transcriptional regulator [Morganella morganii]|uniref:LysR family transcriptional regulator n=1 Tax=Morganella morganii TaxID=582 RepID=UPI0034D51C6B
MNFQQLKYFAETAKQNSISGAASKLYVSQPALSAAIKELETELDIRLFDRNSKGVTLTNDGLSFLRLALEILEKVDDVKKIYKNSTTLKFQVSSQHYAFVIDAFINFININENKKFNLRVKETKTLDVIEDVYQNKSHLGIICLTESNKNVIVNLLEKKSILFNELITVHPHIFIRRTHPLAQHKKINIRELTNYPAVMYAQNNSDFLSEMFFMEEAIVIEDPDRVIYTHDRGSMNNILSNTNSYTIGTGCLIKDIIPDDITAVPIEHDNGEMVIGWIHSNNNISEEEELFISLLKQSLDKNFIRDTQK